jgi:hypothetical protein
MVITAWPNPSAQSVLNSGVPGDGGLGLITTEAEETEVQRAALVTVKV